MLKSTERFIDCPFCNITFLSRNDYAQHASMCSIVDAYNKIDTIAHIEKLRENLRGSINKVLPIINFVHEFEETDVGDRDRMYVCTNCFSNGFGPLIPESCLVCGSKKLIHAKEFLEEILVDD